MRRLIFALSLPLLSSMLLACEDGPNQTYSPAPAGADQVFNNGNTDAAVNPGNAGFVVEAGGTNQVVLCDGPTIQKTWAKAFAQPVLPPRKAGGLDIAGGESWAGLTIEQAEDPKMGGLCQSTNFGDLRGDGTLFNGWGDNGEIYVNYRVSNHIIIGFLLFQGYNGVITANSRDGMHTYTIPIASQIQKDSTNFELHWSTTNNYLTEANELYDAMIATFAPGFPADPDCQASRRCIVGSFGDVAYFYIPALASALWIPSRSAAQPAPSIVNRLDQDLAKVLPYSFANPFLKLDPVGPVAATTGNLGIATTPCSLTIGLSYSDFISNCVKVAGTSDDTEEQNKLLGGLTHGTERFHFDVQGVDVNFTDNALTDQTVITDKDLPHPTDTATELSIDQSTLGVISNDHVGNDPNAAIDNHGAGLVYMEYARLVQQDLTALILADPTRYPGAVARSIGDPACLSGTGNTIVYPVGSTGAPAYAPGCTGFEGIVATAPVSVDPMLKKNALGYTNAVKVLAGLDGGLKPGHLQVAFCLDATGDVTKDYKLCSSPTAAAGDIVGSQGDIYITSFNRVLAVLGQSKVGNLPTDAQDVRFFFRDYVRALLKYLTVAGTVNETIAGVHAATIDSDNLFFDSIGAGQFEIGEYVDRRFVTSTAAPVDLVVTADVKNGIFDSYDFSGDLFRGEEVLYTSMQTDQSLPLGAENTALLTNMFGSPLLFAAYKDIPAADPTAPPEATAYFCATGCNSVSDCGHYDPAKCTTADATPIVYAPPGYTTANPTGILLDDKGRPILAPYKGAIGTAQTTWTLGGQTSMRVTKTIDNIQSAVVQIDLHTDPYDQTSDPPANSSITRLIDWTPKQAGIGFPVALTGTRDKFIETSQLAFAGDTIAANIDYDSAVDKNTGLPVTTGQLAIKAVETTDFLGDLFLCQDPQTLDILRARMYTTVGSILDWFAAHPGTYASCQIIIRYSPYGNYADYITSLVNGVRLGITQGGGYGRVVDGTLFVPGQ